MKIRFFSILVSVLVFSMISCAVQQRKETLKPSAEELNIIPKPVSTIVYDKKLAIVYEILVVARTVEEKELVTQVRGLFEGLGIKVRDVESNPDGQVQVLLKSHRSGATLGEEGYTLEVDETGVKIIADSKTGLFYGVQSLAQLLPSVSGEPILLPYTRIIDHPELTWRGLHLDVVRHFFPVSFVKKYIDQMAKYKLNVLHLHLTDDQGWRIEIKKYPKLTEVGSIRKETIVGKNFDPYEGDGSPYGGFYTQREIRDIVSYAAKRHITVVPEIEMPGHAVAALAAYPQYSCTGATLDVRTKWGVSSNIFCPSEETFEFLTDILDEVIELFPSEYIHVGGDEVPKAHWKESAVCQTRMKQEGLETEEQLQNYFMERIEKHLISKKKKLIGWDEILEGDRLTKTATVMSWRGEAGGIKAANLGHDVVMTPGYAMYFDFYQGDVAQEPLAICCYTPLKKVYDYSPVSERIDRDKQRHIIGVQGNVWTEYMPTGNHVEYMVFPRALALAELAWTPKTMKDWESFQNRLSNHFARFERDNVNYRLPQPEGLESNRIVSTQTLEVNLASYVDDGEIRYTLDGSAPTKGSSLYSGPITLDFNQNPQHQVKAMAIAPSGKESIISSATFRKMEGDKKGKGDYLNGLRLRIVDGVFSNLDKLVKTKSHHEEVVPSPFEIPRIIGWYSRFGLVYEGFIEVEQDGNYVFDLKAEGGQSRLYVGEKTIDGSGKLEMELKAGLVPVRLFFFNESPDYDIELTCDGLKSDDNKIPIELLWHEE